jgi:hypothetical protein
MYIYVFYEYVALICVDFIINYPRCFIVIVFIIIIIIIITTIIIFRDWLSVGVGVIFPV